MTDIHALNARWEHHLDDMHARLWQRMKASGVTAQWTESPEGGAPGASGHGDDGAEGSAPPLYEFTVWHGDRRLGGGTLDHGSPENHAVMMLVAAATLLEDDGVQVMRRA